MSAEDQRSRDARLLELRVKLGRVGKRLLALEKELGEILSLEEQAPADSGSTAGADVVGDIWKFYLHHRKAFSPRGLSVLKLTPKRRAMIRGRLDEYGEEDVKRAIVTLMDKTRFWASPVDSKGKKKRPYVDLQYALRSGEQVEKILASEPINAPAPRSLVTRDDDGNRLIGGKRVFHAIFHVPPELKASGEFVVMSPNDPRLKDE